MLKDKIIIVTGGNGLIGRSIINYLQNKGAKVINADIKSNSILEDNFFNCDITNENSVANLVKTVFINFGRIDGFVNNAYPRTSDWSNKFEDIVFDSWQKNIDMQLNSIFITTKAVLEIMKKQNFGSIVNVSSIYGSVAPDFSIYEGTNMTMPAAYSAIKGGVISYTKYLASYFGIHGVRVNCVSPGGIFNNQPEEFVQNYINKVPLKRMGLPKDISPAVAFLLSEDSNYITGQNLIIDGGYTII